MPLVKSISGSQPPLVMVLESLPKRDKGRVLFEVRSTDVNGAQQFMDRVDFTSARSRAGLVANINRIPGVAQPVTDAMLIQVFAEFTAWQAQPAPCSDFVLTLRRMTEVAAQGTSIPVENPPTPEAVRTAFTHAINDMAIAAPNMVLTWEAEHADKLQVLDVDYHHLPAAPSIDFTTALAEAVRPRPLAWWRSHGGGLHFIYIAVPPYAADELAACAALAVMQIDPTASVELLTQTRHPKSRRVPQGTPGASHGR
jgi:hypothetical protein